MLIKTFRFTAFLFLSLSLIITILFPLSSSANDMDLEAGDPGNNPLNIVIEPSLQNKNGENEMNEMKMSEYPDLGDDQVFPFIAGLDSFK